MTGPVAPHSPNSCTRTPPGTATLRTRPSTPSPVRYFCPPPPGAAAVRTKAGLSESALSESNCPIQLCPSQLCPSQFVRVSLSKSALSESVCPSQFVQVSFVRVRPMVRPAAGGGQPCPPACGLPDQPGAVSGRGRRAGKGAMEAATSSADTLPASHVCVRVCARAIFLCVCVPFFFLCARATKGHSSESESSSSMRSPPQSRSS